MHGELLKARCTGCGAARVWRDDLGTGAACPSCGRAGGLRPDVVWFGEIPRGLDAIDAALAASDVFVAVGTSGAVHPAAGLVETARALGLRTVELNLEPSDNASAFDAAEYGPASEVVPRFVDRLLAGRPLSGSGGHD
jgi:NAD-dependent deacetylase